MKCKELLICSLVVLLGDNIQAKRPIKKVLELVKEIRYDMVDEIVEALAPLLNNCGGGGGDGEEEVGGNDGSQGIFIAGGETSQTYRTEAYYNPVTNELCDIPHMMYPASYGCAVADPYTDSVIVIAGYGDYDYSI